MFKNIYKFAPRNRTPTKHSTCSRPLKYVNKVKHHGSLLYKTHKTHPFTHIIKPHIRIQQNILIVYSANCNKPRPQCSLSQPHT